MTFSDKINSLMMYRGKMSLEDECEFMNLVTWLMPNYKRIKYFIDAELIDEIERRKSLKPITFTPDLGQGGTNSSE